jgi:parvulin-like peptidyl-prolyl isomerase
MIRTLKTHLLLLAVATLIPGRVSAAQPTPTNTVPGAQASGVDTNRVLAKGKGLKITRGQLDKEVDAALAQAQAQGRRVTAEQIPDVERQVLEQLINVRLVLAKATAADKDAGKDAAEKRYATAKAKTGSDESFELQLKFMATTREAVLAKWTEALTADAVLKRELKIAISDQEARSFYDENQAQFDLPEKVRASHILIATLDPQTGAELSADQKAEKRKKAEAVLKQARAGQDFAKLALAFSNDAGSRARGGEYVFARGQMPPEIDVAAFALKPGQISDLITTTNGYHIIKVSEKLPAHKIEFAEAVADIKNGLAQQTIQQQFPDYIARVRAEAGLEILDEQLKPQDPLTSGFPVPRPRAPTEKSPQAK